MCWAIFVTKVAAIEGIVQMIGAGDEVDFKFLQSRAPAVAKAVSEFIDCMSGTLTPCGS
jgi:hypothetical protein